MKPAHPILRITTLFVFVTLISGFVAYRSGMFNDIIYGERIAVNTGNAAADSPVVDSVKPAPVMMPSTKSVYIPDDHPASTDADKANNKKSKSSNKSNNAEPVIMPSSKSGPVFIPEPDTAKKAPQQQQQQPKK